MNDAGEVKFSSPATYPPANPSEGVTDMYSSTEKSPQTEGKALNREVHPTDEEIGLRAYQIYVERGGADGHDVDDWVQAERELFGKYQRTEPMVKKAGA
jgi:hypothetical protein